MKLILTLALVLLCYVPSTALNAEGLAKAGSFERYSQSGNEVFVVENAIFPDPDMEGALSSSCTWVFFNGSWFRVCQN